MAVKATQELLDLAIRTARRSQWHRKEDAEELAGIALLYALEKFKSDGSEGAETRGLRAWVVRITKQVVFQYTKRRRGRFREELKSEMWWEHVTVAAPKTEAPFAEFLLGLLTAEERECLELRYTEGNEVMPDRIAQRTGRSTYKVNLILRSAYDKLERAMNRTNLTGDVDA